MKGGVKDEEGSQEETETSADRQMVTETGRQEATCTTKNWTLDGGREGGRMDSFAWRGKKITQAWIQKDEVRAALTASEADIIWEHTTVNGGREMSITRNTHTQKNTPDQNNGLETVLGQNDLFICKNSFRINHFL